MVLQSGAGNVPIMVVEAPPPSYNARDLRCTPQLLCRTTVGLCNYVLPVSQDYCTPGCGYSLQAMHHIAPLVYYSRWRPACHWALKWRLYFLVGGCETTWGQGVHVLQTTSARKAACTAHVVCTRCLHVLHGHILSVGG